MYSCNKAFSLLFNRWFLWNALLCIQHIYMGLHREQSTKTKSALFGIKLTKLFLISSLYLSNACFVQVANRYILWPWILATKLVVHSSWHLSQGKSKKRQIHPIMYLNLFLSYCCAFAHLLHSDLILQSWYFHILSKPNLLDDTYILFDMMLSAYLWNLFITYND